MKIYINYFWSVRHQFVKYFVVGVSGVVIDLFTLMMFKEWFGMVATLAVVVNQAIMIIYNFTLNKYWSFANKEMPHRQVVRYLILFAINYVFSVVVMYLFSDKMGFDYRIVRLSTIALMVGWNFFLYKYWVYKPDIS